MKSFVYCLFATVGLLAACADDAECDDGQVLEENRCVEENSGSAGSAGTSTAGTGSGAGGAGADMFGATCTDDETHAECGGNATYCAIQPGQSEGYCTATGCVEDPSVCPDGWGCLNLAAFDPSLPSVCTQP